MQLNLHIIKRNKLTLYIYIYLIIWEIFRIKSILKITKIGNNKYIAISQDLWRLLISYGIIII